MVKMVKIFCMLYQNKKKKKKGLKGKSSFLIIFPKEYVSNLL